MSDKPAKTWEQMTQAEKIEDLRRDVLRIFAVLQRNDRRLNMQANHIDAARDLAKKVAVDLEALKSGASKD
jgi:hypothetical protein